MTKNIFQVLHLVLARSVSPHTADPFQHETKSVYTRSLSRPPCVLKLSNQTGTYSRCLIDQDRPTCEARATTFKKAQRNSVSLVSITINAYALLPWPDVFLWPCVTVLAAALNLGRSTSSQMFGNAHHSNDLRALRVWCFIASWSVCRFFGWHRWSCTVCTCNWSTNSASHFTLRCRRCRRY